MEGSYYKDMAQPTVKPLNSEASPSLSLYPSCRFGFFFSWRVLVVYWPEGCVGSNKINSVRSLGSYSGWKEVYKHMASLHDLPTYEFPSFYPIANSRGITLNLNKRRMLEPHNFLKSGWNAPPSRVRLYGYCAHSNCAVPFWNCYIIL